MTLDYINAITHVRGTNIRLNDSQSYYNNITVIVPLLTNTIIIAFFPRCVLLYELLYRGFEKENVIYDLPDSVKYIHTCSNRSSLIFT